MEGEDPLNGSWVAELEQAKKDLTKALSAQQPSGNEERQQQGGEDRGAAASSSSPNDSATSSTTMSYVLKAHLRVCRAYDKLRRWNQLLAASEKALNYARSCPTPTTGSPPAGEATGGSLDGATTSSSLREYRNRAKEELAYPSWLNARFQEASRTSLTDMRATINDYVVKRGTSPELVQVSGLNTIANATMLQEVAVRGDVRMMEMMVALGGRIDAPFPDRRSSGDSDRLGTYPPGATALLLLCANLASPETKDPAWIRARDSGSVRALTSQDLDRYAECAMQLIRLGADPNQKMPLGLGPLFAPFERKSAFQIAAMSKCRPLVALMWDHMQLSPEERAEVVHCRCGSRLPWKQCHLTGAGQPSHYLIESSTNDVCYRVSPMARCPCKFTKKIYYKCCWNDNRYPIYMHDKCARYLRQYGERPMPKLVRCLVDLAAHDPVAASALMKAQSQHEDTMWIRPCAAPLLREHPSLFAALCEDAGPKTRIAEWDAHVYAGCLERLVEPFFWKDVHWDFDGSMLLRLSDEWNKALERYCDDVGLVGEERERVISTHVANPCGPCGYADCSAVESKVLEFQRCAKCKAIAYCGRKCQKKDWVEHQKVCMDQAKLSAFPQTVIIDGAFAAWRSPSNSA